MKHRVMTVLLWLLLGACVGIGAVLAVVFGMRTSAEGLGTIEPCELVFRLRDTDGAPISGAQLILMDARDGKAWDHIGNWNGPGSLVTDRNGEAVFTLTEARRYGGYSWRIFGYERNQVPQPRLEIRYKAYPVFGLPLTPGINKATVEVVCDRDALL
jgi:hypothetical protein